MVKGDGIDPEKADLLCPHSAPILRDVFDFTGLAFDDGSIILIWTSSAGRGAENRQDNGRSLLKKFTNHGSLPGGHRIHFRCIFGVSCPSTRTCTIQASKI
jgi:hypothetical protein